MALKLHLETEAITAFCRRHQIRRLSLFGSVLTDRFGPESDLDLLVEFEPQAAPSLLDIAAMELELMELAGREVDLRTPQDLSRYFREEVLRVAEPIYAAA